MGQIFLPEAYKCKYCGSQSGEIDTAGPHIKLSCTQCKKYLQFLSKDNYRALIDLQPENRPILEVFEDRAEADAQTGFDKAMAEINFKLDLILDHFQIKTDTMT